MIKALHNNRAFFFVVSITMISCHSEPAETSSVTPDSVAVIPQSAGTGFYDIPSPIQQVQLLQQAGAKYDQGLLNPLDNVSKYIQTNSKALNLGVYGSDLSYAAVFNNPQDVVLYLNACQTLANELNITGDFHAEMMLRME